MVKSVDDEPINKVSTFKVLSQIKIYFRFLKQILDFGNKYLHKTQCHFIAVKSQLPESGSGSFSVINVRKCIYSICN